MFIFEIDEDICPFSNNQWCNNPLRSQTKFCKSYGNLNKRPDNCRLVEIDSDDCSDVIDVCNEVEDIIRKLDDFPFSAWWTTVGCLREIFKF